MKTYRFKHILHSFGFTVLLAWYGIANSQAPNDTLDVAKETEQVLSVLDASYVYPDVAKRIRAEVEKKILAGDYQQISSRRALIKKLQTDLRATSKDGHISLHLAQDLADRTSHILPVSAADKEVEFSAITEESAKQKIGYLRFNKFSGDAQTRDRIAKAMDALKSTDAMIIDLRENIGGDPVLVAFLASYFVDHDTHLWSILDRDGNTVSSALSNTQAQRYHGNLCLLIAERTYSAAEAFAYTLKHLGRACIAGEASGGGAHLVQMEKVNEHIDIRIPVVRAYNQITQSNWEGTGVIPTIATEPAEAKAAAIKYLQSREPLPVLGSE